MAGFFRKTLVNLGTRVAGMAANSLALIIIARGLGPQQQGELAGASLLPAFAGAFCGFAFNSATVRLLGQKQFSPGTAFGQNVIFSVFSSMLGVMCGIATIQLFGSNLFPHNDRLTLYLALASLPTIIAINLFSHVLMGIGEMTLFSVAGILSPLLLLPVLALAYFFNPGLVTVKSVLLLQAVTGAMAAACAAYWCVKHVGGADFIFNRAYQTAAMKFGLVVYASSLVAILDDRIGLFIANLFLSPADVGQYSVSIRLAEGLWLISIAMANVIFPISAASRDDRDAVDFSCLVCRASFLITFAAATVLWLVAPQLISFLFSEAYLPAVGPFRILLPGIVAISVWRILANDLIGRGNPLPVTVIAVISLAVNAAAAFLLVRRWGLTGIALSVSMVYWLRLVLTGFVYCRRTGASAARLWLPTSEDMTIYAGALRKGWAQLAARR